MNILIADPIDESALEYFTNNHIAFDYKPAITTDSLLEEIPRFQGLLVRSRTRVTTDVLSAGRQLKVIARIGSGFDNIDVDTCRRMKIVVVNSPEANSIAVAEFTVGLMIGLLRNFPKAFSSMNAGLWRKDELWGGELHGKTVGIVGYGHVGKRVEELVKAFGAKTMIHSRSYQTVSLKEVFERGDIITIHLSLNEKTQGCISRDLFSIMKPGAYFLNIARGPVVDEKALFSMLKDKKIQGAALDVYWEEPLAPNSRWRKLGNVILTPHIGAATKEALKRASTTVAEDVVRVLNGEKPKYNVW